MNKLSDITSWYIKRWIGTGGTRAKCFVENPKDGKEYFFKESIDRYPSEFWSEIISSKIGKYLGFNLLDYNVAILYDTVGCICESMVNQKTEELEHGVNLIKNSVKDFILSERPVIRFFEVEQSFENYKGFINDFINILIFDAVIGNQDRHSENWAIIRSLDVSNEEYNRGKVKNKLYKLYKISGLNLKNIPFKTFFLKYMNKREFVDTNFAPIYDSGSSLGREIPENKIHNFINDDYKINKYIKNGKSEIRWKDKKINHFELLKKIKAKYPILISKKINNVLKIYKLEDVERIINEIDNEIPPNFKETKLSLQRKKLIITFIKFRIKKLSEVLN